MPRPRWHNRGVVFSGVFGPAELWPAQDLIAVSDEFDAPLVLAAYLSGVFPMPLHDAGFAPQMSWWSPVQRGVLTPDGLRVPRSLRQSAKHYRVTFNEAFGEVLRRCADPRRPHGWIDADIVEVYTELHRQGYAHSVEAWTPDGRLAGGLYGMGLGGLFAGESMFHDPVIGRDASKVALVRLVDLLSADGVERIIDTQWLTPHLATLGALDIDRRDYLDLVDELVTLPPPDWTSAARKPPPPLRDASPGLG